MFDRNDPGPRLQRSLINELDSAAVISSDDEPNLEDTQPGRSKKGIRNDVATLVREAEGLHVSRKPKKQNNRNVQITEASEPPESAAETPNEDRSSSSSQNPVSI